MGGTTRLWLTSAGLLAGAGVLTGMAVTRYWQPCAENMLTGSVFNGYRYEPQFSDTCLSAMDEAPAFPLPTAGEGWTAGGWLGVVAAVLLAAAWLRLIPSLRVSGLTRLVAALPGVIVIALAVSAAVPITWPPGSVDLLGLTAYLLVDVATLLAFAGLAGSGMRGIELFRYGLVLLAATSVGGVRQVLEYVVAVSLSDANWDSPPGTGYLTVAFIGLAALTTFVLGCRQGSRGTAAAARPVATPA